jgi:hypothetical protein
MLVDKIALFYVNFNCNNLGHGVIMANLPLKTTEIINQLKQQALDIVNEASAWELTIFELFGETEATMSALDEMKSAAEDAESSYSQLSTIQLQIAKAQPIASPDMLQLLERAIARTQARIPALDRSIEEVKMEYNLP